MSEFNQKDQSEEDRIIKQEFLRDEIISGGFEPMEFKEFCDGLKPDGNNIDLIFDMYIV